MATVRRRIGNRQRAEGALATAIAMLRETDMRYWLADAEAEAARVSR